MIYICLGTFLAGLLLLGGLLKLERYAKQPKEEKLTYGMAIALAISCSLPFGGPFALLFILARIVILLVTKVDFEGHTVTKWLNTPINKEYTK